jgi:hypothetical protein
MPDYAFWTNIGFKDLTADAGFYEVCFCAGGSCDADEFFPIPGPDGPLLEVIATLRVTHDRSVFHNAMFSGTKGTVATLTVHGNFLVHPLESRLVLADDCGKASVKGVCRQSAALTRDNAAVCLSGIVKCESLDWSECGGEEVNKNFPCCTWVGYGVPHDPWTIYGYTPPLIAGSLRPEANSSFCLQQNASDVNVHPTLCTNITNQSFAFNATPSGKGVLQNLLDDSCLEYDSMSGVVFLSAMCHGGAKQIWHINEDGTVGTDFDSKCLTVDENITTVMMDVCHGGVEQRWRHPQREVEREKQYWLANPNSLIIAEGTAVAHDVHSWTFEVPIPDRRSTRVCLCDSLSDRTLSGATGFGLVRYKETQSTAVVAAHLLPEADKCNVLCVSGNPLAEACAEYEPEDDEVLCLDLLACVAVCEDNAECTGIEMRGTHRCRLLPLVYDTEKRAGFTIYEVEPGKPCRDTEDFVDAGLLSISPRAHFTTETSRISWVLSPDTLSSLDVIGDDLSANDRVMFVDENGMCGRSTPPSELTVELSNLDLEESREASEPVFKSLGPASLEAFSHWRPLLADGGAFSPEWQAEDELEALFAALAGADGSVSEDEWAEASSSALKKYVGTTFSEVDTDGDGFLVWDEFIAPDLDRGFSTSKILRFPGLRMATGGRAKVCFCDSAYTKSDCTLEEHFLFDIGLVHSSGVACLLVTPELQRATCVPQYHGGLRCYDNADAVPSRSFDQSTACGYVRSVAEGGGWRYECPGPAAPVPGVDPTPKPTPVPTVAGMVCESVTGDRLEEVAGCRMLTEAESEAAEPSTRAD